MTKKEKFRHLLLNQLTIVNLLTQADTLTEQDKNTMVHALRITNLLVTFEDLFLDSKIDLHKSKVNLREVIDTTISSFDSIKKDCEFISISNDVEVGVDRHYFGKAIDLLFKRLLACTSFIEFKFDGGVLNILHKCGEISVKQDKDLIDYCNGNSDNLGFQIGIKILELLNIQFSSSENEINLKFPN